MSNVRRVLESDVAPGIKIYGIQGTTQYIVVTPGSEYSFTTEEDAQVFAKQLAVGRDVFKTASFDPEVQASNVPPVVKEKPKKRWL